jgi:metal-responsive CopG/Arc/MetJ family transcriptional regulator
MAVRIATNLSLPKDLVDELDAVAGKRNRSAYVEETLRERLRRERVRRVWDKARGMLTAEEYPHWATSELVQQWVRDRRAEETDAGPER